MATSERADEPQFAASEVNLLIYHYPFSMGNGPRPSRITIAPTPWPWSPVTLAQPKS